MPKEITASIIVIVAASITIFSLFLFQTNVQTPSSGLDLIKTITVAPDDNFGYGAFCRINYVNSTGRFVITFNPDVNIGIFYKEYTTDMAYTGRGGRLSEKGGDYASVMVDDYYYLLRGGGQHRWRIDKYDAITWELVDEVFVEYDPEYETGNDQMLAYINGQLDASSLNDPEGVEKGEPGVTSGPNIGEATHHHFYSLDLEPQGKKVLNDTGHVNGMSAIFVEDTYYFVTSTAFLGEIIIMKYDRNWNYLGTVETGLPGRWPQGTAYKDNKFYVAYVDLSKPGENIVLAIFDQGWNLLTKNYITDLAPEDGKGDRPHVLLFNNKIYVSYDISKNRDWKCIVNVYEENQ